MVLPRFIALRSARRRRKAGRARARSLRSRTRQPRRKALSAVCLNPRFRAREADVRSTDRTTVLKGSTAVIDAAEESLKIGFPIPSRSLQSNGATSHPDAPQVHAENRPWGLAPLIPAHGCPSLTDRDIFKRVIGFRSAACTVCTPWPIFDRQDLARSARLRPCARTLYGVEEV